MFQILQYEDKHREAVHRFYTMHVYEVAGKLKQLYHYNALAQVQEPMEDYLKVQLQPFIELKPPEGMLLVIEEDGSAVGMGAFVRLKEDIGEIRRMFILPEHRGKGYGQKLLDQLILEGRKMGVLTFYLSTYLFMDVAEHIYKKAGFKESEPYQESTPYQNMWKYLKFMEKKEDKP